MAEAYAFALLVELERNPNIPKLKNKLIKYFQSKKSDGGDCLVEYEDGQEAVVRFKTEEVRHRVLEKQEHEIRLDRGVLKLTIGLPSDDVPKNVKETQSPVTSGKYQTFHFLINIYSCLAANKAGNIKHSYWAPEWCNGLRHCISVLKASLQTPLFESRLYHNRP
ncbi:unnamed protein product [Oncorhynchus mykiss]|uniref:PAR14-like first RRM domain-containing protein n=1 Tax=Oncorhynchus mykiss TaxID=8022 RepID=A0A060WIG3_ONCMY|nr:unnamed protein product [Oncorhynchus mykiss]